MAEKDWGQWKVQSPSTYAEGAVTFGVQVTAPIPLSGLQDLFKVVAERNQMHPLTT